MASGPGPRRVPDVDIIDVTPQRRPPHASQMFMRPGSASQGPPPNPQDYQMQLQLLEQQNRRRMMMARAEQDMPPSPSPPNFMNPPAQMNPPPPHLTPGQPQPVGVNPSPNPNLNPTPAPQPRAEPSSPQTHYTISEDEVGVGQSPNLAAAFKPQPDLSQNSPPAAVSPPAQHGPPMGMGRGIGKGMGRGQPPPPMPLSSQGQHMLAQQQARQQQLQQQQLARQMEQQRQMPMHPMPGTGPMGRPPPTLPMGGRGVPPPGFHRGPGMPPVPGPGAPLRSSTRMIPSGIEIPSSDSAAPAPPSPALSPDSFDTVQQYVEYLEARLGIAKGNQEVGSNSPAINIQDIYCLDDHDEDCLAEPVWDVQDDQVMLKSRFLVHHPDGYIEKKGNIAFAVFKHYTIDHQKSKVQEAMKLKEPLPTPEPAYQSIRLISGDMIEAMTAFAALHPTFCIEFPELGERQRKESGETLKAPFVWWYHYRKSNKIEELPTRQAELMTALGDWIETNYGDLFDKIDTQFDNGQVSRQSIEYLMRPGDVLLPAGLSVLGDAVLPKGYVALSRPELLDSLVREPHERDKPKYWWSLGIKARSYIYAGNFLRKEQMIILDFEADAEDGEVDITSLNFVPIRYSSDEVRQVLERRGKEFWKCRSKRLVSYKGSPKSKDKKQMGQRFMTDFSTYQTLHPENKYTTAKHDLKGGWLRSLDPRISGTKLDTKLPTDGSDLTAPEIYLFPTHIPGFDLRRKKWVDLEVDQIGDVDWNDQAFKSLVADDDMKQLILALVTNQLDSETATDLIDNKGNGLIMLLHGSPGTGKTFTAESVAEIAKKPLYPVTCGDIGTEPEAVEKYLASVFHLGKIWDCVVLLDEAEVFLEQRTLQDLKRNALVSVFLRALEYYEGILILTTNRVGSFDEAFKSRIQLALRYERLRDDQRKQIWRNFLERLQVLGEGESIDFEDVMGHLDELASHPMNGREIRNCITTGRQLARFMKEKMTVSHLRRAIGVAEKFDRYLADVREADVDGAGGRGEDGRYSDDYFARVDQLR